MPPQGAPTRWEPKGTKRNERLRTLDAAPAARTIARMHTKDFWFRSIWIDLHQAFTIDRESSRDRAPIGLVRCICKDDYVKGKHTQVKQHSRLCSSVDGPHDVEELSSDCSPELASVSSRAT